MVDFPRVIYPPNDLTDRGDTPVLFTAGPIQGAPDWQSQVPEIMAELGGRENFNIANPRAPVWHGDYYAQLEWETLHLVKASINGVILFWLAKETEHHCDRAYAQTSRFELGEWVGRKRMSQNKINIVVGIEEGFSNERYIRRRLSGTFPGMFIHSILETACEEAQSLLSTL